MMFRSIVHIHLLRLMAKAIRLKDGSLAFTDSVANKVVCQMIKPGNPKGFCNYSFETGEILTQDLDVQHQASLVKHKM